MPNRIIRAAAMVAATAIALVGSAAMARPVAPAGPAYKPCQPASGLPMSAGPCTAKASDMIWFRLEKSLEAAPTVIVFRQALEGTSPVTFRVPFPKGELKAGTLYSLPVPPRMCATAGKPWDINIVGGDGKPVGIISRIAAECS